MLMPDDFHALTETEKADLVWSGTFLADREENGLTIQLYSLPGFYVVRINVKKALKLVF